MRKLFLSAAVLLIYISYGISGYAQTIDEKPLNPGYAKRYGMVGLFGHLPDYINDSWTDMAPGGGGFIYYNVLNDFWGNLSLGVSAEYVAGSYKDNNIRGYAHMAPIAFNVAYMTSSDVLNFWIGVGVSYNFVNFDMSGGTYSDGTFFHKNKYLQDQVVGVDAFAGAEYIFTKNGRWGAFFEFRYTYAEKANFSLNAPETAMPFSATIDTQRFRYTVGFSYHF